MEHPYLYPAYLTICSKFCHLIRQRIISHQMSETKVWSYSITIWTEAMAIEDSGAPLQLIVLRNLFWTRSIFRNLNLIYGGL